MNSLQSSLLVGAGAFVGANARYWLGVAFKGTYNGDFPWPTFCINLLGCLLIGFVMGALIHRANWIHPFLVVGILGGFTTFSSFGFETLFLIRTHQWGLAAAYVLGSVVLGVGFTAVGWWLSRPLAP